MIFINRFFYPDHSATSQMLSDLAFALAAEGQHVTVIASRQRYDAPQARLPAHETIGGVEVRRVWTSRFGRSVSAGRAVDYLTFYLSAAWQLWRLARPREVVIAKTDPPLFSIIAALVARSRRAKLVNWLQDVFPEIADKVGGGRGRLSRAFYALLKLLRDRSLKRSTLTVVIGERMAQLVASFGVSPARIRIVPNWADGTLVQPLTPESNPLRKEWGLRGAMVVGYSGNLGRTHDYRTILDAVTRLERSGGARSEGPPIVWLFIGGGAQYEAFKREIEGRGLSSVRFQPYQPRERLAESLSVPDVHLVTLRPSLEGLVVPSKFYGVAAAGRPTIFIGDGDGEIARILHQHRCGVVVAEGDGVGLVQALAELAAHPELRVDMGGRARKAFERHYDKAVAMGHWRAVLHEIKEDCPVG